MLKIKNEKIVSLLKSLSRYELNRFRKFLLSPYFNENEQLISFYDVLASKIIKEQFNESRENIWRDSFGTISYHEQKYRRLCSDLTQLCYRFLSVEWSERESLSMSEGILRKVNSENLHKHYLTALRNIRKKLEEWNLRNTDYHYYRYISEYESHIHLERTNAKRSTLSNLQLADYHLDVYYIINKLKHYCDALTYKSILSIEIDVKILPNLLEFIENNNYLSHPSIHIYYRILKTLTESENTNNYFDLVNLLEEHYLLFPPSELRILYIYATNYCIRKINLGHKEFFKVLYELYSTVLQRKTIFSIEGELDERHYKNIISLGIRLQDFDGVEKFVLEFSPLLNKTVRDNALTYNLAHIYYSKKDFGKVIEQLRYVEYQSIVYALGSKLMLLKTYYHLDEYNVMDANIDSFRIYLRRNKLISRKVKQQYLNFLKFLKKISTLPLYHKEEIIKLKENIKNTDQLISKRWLLDTLDKIENP